MQPHDGCPFTAEQIRNFTSKLIDIETGCQNWLGCYSGDYGRVGIDGKAYTAHRVAYMIFNGPIPERRVVRHKCDNPSCCNPAHLEIGTFKQNSQDMVQRGRTNGPRGERAGNHVLSRVKVSQIKRAINDGLHTQCELARRFGVAKSTIGAIRDGYSWSNIEPKIIPHIPQPHRKFLDQDYADIRQKWRDGYTLKQLASEYECRVDMIQAIVSGKRGVLVPVGNRVLRQNKTKLPIPVLRSLFERHINGEPQVALAQECGMSKNGLCLAFKRFHA